MTNRFIFAALTLAAVAGAALPAAAQQAQPLGGPVIPGVCLLSREAVFANAAAGKAASARLQELAAMAQTEIETERQPLETQLRALEGQPDNAARRQRAEALAGQWQALQQKAAHANQEVEATRLKAMERIANEAQPAIAQVYAAKACGLLLDRNSALGGNFANDLTAEVVQLLDSRLSTITFERERLPQVAAQPAR
ncbi:OmpH family outer membrane protein [Brevundimonas pondensis]|jgi:Skp family chaperone for outer membrane proteins|uniref:OmpH family outer membrane protein n=1 Tax=Brevundimonas pondensis TaxID=2774189 RepID=A0ABX7SP48_9CAUL|nr:OmpH family outer membrane protein [Brevundimonas pondensis]QTC88660.1 OmpH family outer membrane protein [Brevundimonas pondensis]